MSLPSSGFNKPSKKLHGIIFEKTELFITTAVTTSKPTKGFTAWWDSPLGELLCYMTKIIRILR
jgi:hypothetical protein